MKYFHAIIWTFYFLFSLLFLLLLKAVQNNWIYLHCCVIFLQRNHNDKYLLHAPSSFDDENATRVYVSTISVNEHLLLLKTWMHNTGRQMFIFSRVVARKNENKFSRGSGVKDDTQKWIFTVTWIYKANISLRYTVTFPENFTFRFFFFFFFFANRVNQV